MELEELANGQAYPAGQIVHEAEPGSENDPLEQDEGRDAVSRAGQKYPLGQIVQEDCPPM